MMPKGKAEISGVVFTRDYPDFDDDCRCELLDELSAAREKAGREPLICGLREKTWSQIYELVAIYRGQVKSGLPITEMTRDKEIEAIQKQAGVLATKLEALPDGRPDRLRGQIKKLIRLIMNADLHSKDKLTKAMNREVNVLTKTDPYRISDKLDRLLAEMELHPVVARLLEKIDDLPELIDQLRRLSTIDTSVVRYPKSEPNPYMAHLVRSLVCVWEETVGEMPTRTWDPYARGADRAGEEKFPFLEWANRLLLALDAGSGGAISFRLTRKEIELERHQRERGLPPSVILS